MEPNTESFQYVLDEDEPSESQLATEAFRELLETAQGESRQFASAGELEFGNPGDLYTAALAHAARSAMHSELAGAEVPLTQPLSEVSAEESSETAGEGSEGSTARNQLAGNELQNESLNALLQNLRSADSDAARASIIRELISRTSSSVDATEALVGLAGDNDEAVRDAVRQQWTRTATAVLGTPNLSAHEEFNALTALTHLSSAGHEAARTALESFTRPQGTLNQERAARAEFARLLISDPSGITPPHSTLTNGEEILRAASRFLCAVSAARSLTATEARVAVNAITHSERFYRESTDLQTGLGQALQADLDNNPAVIMQAIYDHEAPAWSNSTLANIFREAAANASSETLGENPSIDTMLTAMIDGLSDSLAPSAHRIAIVAEMAMRSGATRLDNSSLSQMSARALEQLANSSATTRRTIVDAIVNAAARQEADTPAMLPVLARIAKELPPHESNPQAFRLIARAFEQRSRDLGNGLSDASSAMVEIARHWTTEDARLFISDLRTDVLTGLGRAAQQMSGRVRDAVIQELESRYKANPNERVSIRQALEPFRTYATVEQIRTVYGREAAEAAERQQSAQSGPQELARLQTIWRSAFADTNFPRSFGNERELEHHMRYDTISHGFLQGTDRTGLDRLRQMTYEDMTGVPGRESVRDYYCRLAYLDSVGRYEAARASNNSTARDSALVDLIVLQRSAACTVEVKDSIDRYLNGERRAGRMTEQHITLATQEYQRRATTAANAAADATVQILRGDGTAAEIQHAMDSLVRHGRDSNANLNTIEYLRQIASLHMVRAAANAFSAPGSLTDQSKVSDLRNALLNLKQAPANSNQERILQAFGGMQNIEELIRRLNLQPPETSGVRDAVTTALRHANVRQALSDGEAASRLPLSPVDLINADLFQGSRLENLRNYGVIAGLERNISRLNDRTRAAERQTILRNSAETIEYLLAREGESAAALVRALGGREWLAQIRAQLTRSEQAPQAVRALNEALQQATVRNFRNQFDQFRAGQTDSTATSRHLETLGEERRAVSNGLQTIVQAFTPTNAESVNTRVRQLNEASDRVQRTAQSSGDQTLQAMANWTGSYTALAQLELALNHASTSTRGTIARAALERLDGLPDSPFQRALIESFGGKDALQRLIARLDREGFAAARSAIEDALRRPAVRQISADALAFKDTSISQLLGSNILTSPDALESFRNDAAVNRLRDALSAGHSTTTRTNELLAAIDQVVLRDSSAAGRELLTRLGGAQSLRELAEDARDSGISSVREQLNALNRAIRSESVATLLQRGRQDIRHYRSLAGGDLFGGNVTQEEIARAIEGARRRGNQLNEGFNRIEADFLSRPEAGSGEQQRTQALTALEAFGRNAFAGGGDDQRILDVPRYRAIHQLLQINEAATPAQKAAELRRLHELALGGNLPAQRMVSEITAGAMPVDRMIHLLERGNEAQQAEALEALSSRLPDGAGAMDELRAAAIMRDLLATESPTLSQIDAVAERLRAEYSHDNESAREWLDWCQANRNIIRLSARGREAATAGDRAQALQELEQQAQNGSVYARQALFALLRANVPGDSGLSINGRPALRPDLNHLDTEARRELHRQSLRAIDALLSASKQVTPAEASSLVIALGQASDWRDQVSLDRAHSALSRCWSEASNQNILSAALHSQLFATPPIAGRREIANLYLRHADNSEFPATFRDVIGRAGSGDREAMYVLAGTLGRNDRRPEVHQMAQRAADGLISNETSRANFLQALIDRNRAAGDQGSLLRTMGRAARRIAGDTVEDSLPQVVKDAREELRTALSQSLRITTAPASVTVDAASRATYASAVRGLLDLAPSITGEDITRLTRTITPELAEALRGSASRIPSTMQHALVLRVFNRLDATTREQGEWIPAIQSLGHLAPYLTREQVTQLARLGNDLSTANPGVNEAIGRSLLLVLANGSAEAKREAASQFASCGWGRSLGTDVSNALMSYARGEEVPAELAARINEVTYGLNIQPSIRNLLRSMNIVDVPQEQLDAAIRRVGGDAQFREMLTQITAYNSLPRILQELVRNNSRNISGISADQLVSRDGNRPDVINVRDLIAQLSRGELPANQNFLSGTTVTQRLEAINTAVTTELAQRTGHSTERVREELAIGRMQNLTGQRSYIPDSVAQEATRRRSESMSELVSETRTGHDTSAWWYAALLVGYPIARQINSANLQARQDNLVAALRNEEQSLARAMGEIRRFQAVIQSVDLSLGARQHASLLARGNTRQADEHLLSLCNEHGSTTVQAFAPDTYSALIGGRDRASAWNRLALNGFTDLPIAPQYSVHAPQVLDQVTETLRLRQLSIRERQSDGSSSVSTDRLRSSADDLIVHDAMRALDTHPPIAQATQAAAEVGQVWQELQRLVRAGTRGNTRSENLSSYIRNMLSRTENGMEVGLQPAVARIEQNLPALRTTLEALRQTQRECTDSTALRLLGQRIDSLTRIIDTFSGPAMDQFKEMIRLANSGSLEATSTLTYLRDTVVPTVAGIALAAAVMAATWGTGAPLVIAGMGVIAAGNLILHEGINEVSYQLNFRGDRGSILGDAIRRQDYERGLRSQPFLVWDSREGKFGLAPTAMQAFEQYGKQIAGDFVMQLALMGFGSAMGAGLRRLDALRNAGPEARAEAARALQQLMNRSGRQAAALETATAALPPVSQSLIRNFINHFPRQFAEQSAMHVATEITQEAVNHTFHTQEMATQIASALIVCAAHRGVTHFTPRLWARMTGATDMQVPENRDTFMRELRQRIQDNNMGDYVRIQEQPNGTVRLTIDGRPLTLSFISPEAAMARSISEQRTLAEGANPTQATDTTLGPTGRPQGWEARRQQVPEAHRAVLSERAQIAREQMDAWVDATANGDYAGASERAINNARDMERDGKATLRLFDVEIPAGRITETLTQTLADMGGTEGRRAQASGNHNHVEINTARPVIRLSDGTRVDMTRFSAQREQLNQTQRSELDAALNTPAGREIMQRAARQHMEEIILHANQLLGGDARLSFVQADFSSRVANLQADQRQGPLLREWQQTGAESHNRAYRGSHESAVAEQEVIALMFERGARWSDIMAVAQNVQHARTRANLLEYLSRLHASAGGAGPVEIAQPVRLPGAPAAGLIGERSGIPRQLLEGGTETPTTRAEVETVRARLNTELQSANLPRNVREVLRQLLPQAAIPQNATAESLQSHARNMAIVHEVLNLPVNLRAHLIDSALSSGGASNAVMTERLLCARTLRDMMAAGVPWENLRRLTPEVLMQLHPAITQVPPHLRAGLIDPVFSETYSRRAFDTAHAEAVRLGQLSLPGQVTEIGRMMSSTTGNQKARLERLLFDTATAITRTDAYASARAAEPNSRTEAQREMIQAFETANTRLLEVIRTEFNFSAAECQGNAMQMFEGRELLRGMQRNLGQPITEALRRAQPEVRRQLLERLPELQRAMPEVLPHLHELINSSRNNDVLRRMTNDQIKQVAELEPAVRRHFLEEILAGRQPLDRLTAQLQQANRFAQQTVREQIRDLRRTLSELEPRQRQGAPLTEVERVRMRYAQELLQTRVQRACQEAQRLERQPTRTAEENDTLVNLRQAIQEEVDFIRRNLDIGNIPNSDSGSANRAESEVLRILREQVNLINQQINSAENTTGREFLTIVRLQGGQVMDGIGYDFVVIDRRTGRYLPFDASARDKINAGDYRGIKLREDSVIHVVPNDARSVADATTRIRNRLGNLDRSPFNIGDIRVACDQAHAGGIRPLTSAELTQHANAIATARTRNRPTAELPNGDVIRIGARPEDHRLIPRDNKLNLADVGRNRDRLGALMGQDTAEARQIATSLQSAIDQAAAQVTERTRFTDRYLEDIQRRADALATADPAASRDLRDLVRNIQGGAQTYSQDKSRFLSQAREVLRRWRESVGQ